VIKTTSTSQKDLFERYENYFQKLAKVKEMKMGDEKPVSSIAAVVQDIEIFLSLEGLIDLQKEKEKLEKQLQKLNKELKVISGKLHNEKFLTNAPEAIVLKERDKFEEIRIKLEKTELLLKDLN